MRRTAGWFPGERYALEEGQYVLQRGDAPVLVTRAVAVLIDTGRGVLITHGDPASVRHELDEMRRLPAAAGAEHREDDWILLEGRPSVERLNAALQNADLAALGEAFTGGPLREALRITRDLLARIAQRR